MSEMHQFPLRDYPSMQGKVDPELYHERRKQTQYLVGYEDLEESLRMSLDDTKEHGRQLESRMMRLKNDF